MPEPTARDVRIEMAFNHALQCYVVTLSANHADCKIPCMSSDADKTMAELFRVWSVLKKGGNP